MKFKLKNKEIELTDEEVQEIVKQNSEPKGVEISRWDNGEVIFTSTKQTMKEAVEEAVNEGVSLAFANLSNANLSNANLFKAKFYGKGGTQKLTKEQVPVFLKALGFIIE